MKKLYIFEQPFHLVTLSPWPLLMSINLFIMLMGAVIMFKFKSMMLMLFGLFMLLLLLFQWWRDVIRESTFQGFHTNKVIFGLKLGMILFIVSEIFFFLSVFWCYFHMYLSPSIEIGAMWPPKNLTMFNPYMIPLLNTIILLSSGVSVTWSHHSILCENKKDSVLSLFITIILGMIFTYVQYLEYLEASFTMADSVFGSIFFFGTGFHGFHVLVGTLFLLVSLLRMSLNHFSSSHHLGFEMAIWYWHFVDIVWLFLYLSVYFLSS